MVNACVHERVCHSPSWHLGIPPSYPNRPSPLPSTVISCLLPSSPSEMQTSDPPTPPSAFAHLLDVSKSHLPPSGPELFEARRRLWTTPPTDSPRPRRPDSPSRTRLRELLHTPGALESDSVWHAGLGRVWKGLVSGGRLRSFLPLSFVVRLFSQYTHATNRYSSRSPE